MDLTTLATSSKLDLAIADAQGKVKYTVLKAAKPRKSMLVLTQTKGIRTNTNRGKINDKHATLIWGSLWGGCCHSPQTMR